MSNLTLYEVASQYREMAAKLIDLDLDEQTIADTLDGESGALVEKGTNVAFVVRNLEASAESIKAAEATMAARRKAIENRAKRLRQYLLMGMQTAGIQKIESPYFNIAIRKNPSAVEVFDANQIPDIYMKVPEPPPAEPDKKAIAQAIKEGFDVPGAKLTQSERVEIK